MRMWMWMCMWTQYQHVEQDLDMPLIMQYNER